MTAMEIFTGTEDATIARREGRKALVRSALIILVVAIVATLPGWLPGKLYGALEPGSPAQRLSVEYAAQRLKVGEIPLWNPNVGLGAPVIGDGVSGLFFPTILLHMFLPARGAWVISAIVMLWLAGFGVVVRAVKGAIVGFASRTGSHSEPYGEALVAGVIFLTGVTCLAFFNVGAANAAALLPWAVLAVENLFRRMSAGRLVGTTLLLLIIFLGGNIAAAGGVVLACVVYLVWNLARQPKEWERFFGAILALVGAVGVAATVAAVQWMPARYNAEIGGINGFLLPRQSVVNAHVLTPVVMLGFALLCGWLTRKNRWHAREVLLWGGPILMLAFGILANGGSGSRQELAQARKWIEGQSESKQVRVIAEGGYSWDLPGNVLNLAETGPRRTKDWFSLVEIRSEEEMLLESLNHPALRLLGTKYLITHRRMPTTQPATAPAPAPTRRLFGRGEPAAAPMGKMQWKPVWPATQPAGEVIVCENVAQPLPRFWVARNAQWADKAQEIFERLRKSDDKADFDPHDVVLLDREGEAESDSGMLRRGLPARGIARLELLEDSPERIRIGTEGAGGWLVLADAYAPGWTAKMSYTAVSRGARRGSARERTYERELPIVPAYGAMRAVPLSGGAEIVFEYEPKGWKHGLMVGGIGAIVLLLMVGGMLFPSASTGGAREAPMPRGL